MKINRFNGETPYKPGNPAETDGVETGQTTELPQVSPGEIQPSKNSPQAKTRGTAPTTKYRSASRAQAASQKGHLDLYGAAQRLKLSVQTGQNTAVGTNLKNRNTPTESRTAASVRMQSFSTGSLAQPSFASQRRNAIPSPLGASGTQQTGTRSEQASFASQRRNAIAFPSGFVPGGDLPVGTRPAASGGSESTTSAQNQQQQTDGTKSQAKKSTYQKIQDFGFEKSKMFTKNTETYQKEKSWTYDEASKSFIRDQTSGGASTDSSRNSTSNSSDTDGKKRFGLGGRRSTIARGSGGLTAYGEGKTLSEASAGAAYTWGGKIEGEGNSVVTGTESGYLVKDEGALWESRTRTFQYDSGFGVGAQGEASLIRYKISRESRGAYKFGGAEIVGASGNIESDNFIGARVTGELGLRVGRDGLPAVGIGGEAFVGARTDARGGGEARLMGIGLAGNATVSAMVGVQAGGEASVGLGGVEASASAFAGTSIAASGSASLAGVGASGSAEAWAGVGARAELDLGYTDGKLQFKLGVGAALGIGGAASIGFTWDPNKTITDAKRFGENTAMLVGAGANAVASALSGSSQLAGSMATGAAKQAQAGFLAASTGVSNVAQTASKEISKLSSNVAQTVTNTASTVANAATAAAGAAANVANAGAKTVATAANTVAQTAAKTATAAAKTVSNAAKSVGQAAANIAKSIFKWF